jgi:hypothetical protein
MAALNSPLSAGISSVTKVSGEDWSLSDSITAKKNTGEFHVYSPQNILDFKRINGDLSVHPDIIGIDVNWRYIFPNDSVTVNSDFIAALTYLIVNDKKVVLRLKAVTVSWNSLLSPQHPNHGTKTTNFNCGSDLPHVPYWAIYNASNELDTSRIYKHTDGVNISTCAVNTRLWNENIRIAYQGFVDRLCNLPIKNTDGTEVPLIAHDNIAGIYLTGLSFDSAEEFFFGTGYGQYIEDHYGFSPAILKESYLNRVKAWERGVERAVHSNNRQSFRDSAMGKVGYMPLGKVGFDNSAAGKAKQQEYSDSIRSMHQYIADSARLGCRGTGVEVINELHSDDTTSANTYFFNQKLTVEGYLSYQWNDMRNRFFQDEAEIVFGSGNISDAKFYFDPVNPELGTDPRIDTTDYSIGRYHATATLLRSAQVGLTHLWSSLEKSAGDQLFKWWKKIANKSATQTHEAVCWLRESPRTSLDKPKIVNLEHFLYQRDFDSLKLGSTYFGQALTEGDFYIVRPGTWGDKVWAPPQWVEQDNSVCRCQTRELSGLCHREATARKIKKNNLAAFFVNDSLKPMKNYTLYINYYDSGITNNGLFTVGIRQFSNILGTATVKSDGIAEWKTAILTVTGLTLGTNGGTFNNNNFDFAIQSYSNNFAIRFVRVVKN